MKGRSSILTHDQLGEMAQLRERGWSYIRIAAHFADRGTHVSPSSICWHCKRLGADAPRRLRGRCFDLRGIYERAGRTVRPWTSGDDAQLLALESEGASISVIGRSLTRADSSVRNRLFTLARRQARQESDSA